MLERILLECISSSDAIKAWTGPLDAPKDFEVGGLCIESKARRGLAAPFVTINSEFQLDDSATENLFLHVAELNPAPSTANGAFSVTDVVNRIMQKVSVADPGAAETLEDRLSSSGFSVDDDYSDSLFIEGTHRVYRVYGEFPRITGADCTSGVSRVRYRVALNDCAVYEEEYENLLESIRSIADVG